MSVTSGAARAAGLMMMLCTAMGDANAAATILLWPIDPWLGSENKATELWIQNQGNTPATMQVRIVRWRQERGDERYQPQTDVVASPPIVTIQKGTKQLIRLIKQTEIPAGTEQAYRIIVDGNPSSRLISGTDGYQTANALLHPALCLWQGDYLLILSANHALVDPRELSWQIVRENGKPALQIRNQGDVHVRLTAVSARQGGQTRVIADGLLGYVLPGKRVPGRSLPGCLPLSAKRQSMPESEWQSPAR